MKASRRVNLYLPANLADEVIKLAREDGRSVNQYVARVLRRHVQDRVNQTKPQEARTTEIPVRFG